MTESLTGKLEANPWAVTKTNLVFLIYWLLHHNKAEINIPSKCHLDDKAPNASILTFQNTEVIKRVRGYVPAEVISRKCQAQRWKLLCRTLPGSSGRSS